MLPFLFDTQPMAMSQILSPLVLTIFYLLILLHQISSTTTPISFRLDLTHVDACRNFTKIELFRRAALRSKARMEHILTSRSSPINQVQVPVRPSEGEYILDLAIGTPPLAYSAVLDSGSDLIWTQCKPCHVCLPQPTPFYDPTQSKTHNNISCSNKFCKALPAHICDPYCNFFYRYADNSSNHGVLGTETFVFGSRKRATIHNVVFGCSHYTSGSTFNNSGLVGFGRGPLSLISQLGIGKFSYCFTAFGKSIPSPVFFGSLAKLNRHAIGQVQSTRIIRVSANPSFYYISLKAITVGDTLLPIPKSTFALSKNGTGGMIIDSGTSVTRLQPEGFKIFMEALTSHVKLPLDENDCFVTDGSSVENVKFPKLIFHFKGADLELEKGDYVVADEDRSHCLAIGASFDDTAIWGNIQQQNFHILHDLEKEKLSFVRAQCEKL